MFRVLSSHAPGPRYPWLHSIRPGERMVSRLECVTSLWLEFLRFHIKGKSLGSIILSSANLQYSFTPRPITLFGSFMQFQRALDDPIGGRRKTSKIHTCNLRQSAFAPLQFKVEIARISQCVESENTRYRRIMTVMGLMLIS